MPGKDAEPTNCDCSQVHRLCLWLFNKRDFKCFNFDQTFSFTFREKSGRLSKTVSCRTLIRILFLHTGQRGHCVSNLLSRHFNSHLEFVIPSYSSFHAKQNRRLKGLQRHLQSARHTSHRQFHKTSEELKLGEAGKQFAVSGT